MGYETYQVLLRKTPHFLIGHIPGNYKTRLVQKEL